MTLLSGMSDDLVIRWEIDEISKLTNDGRYSPFHHHRNIPWRLLACTGNSKHNVEYFSLYIYCNEEDRSDLWSMLVWYQFAIINRDDPKKCKLVQYTDIFSKAEEYHWGTSKFMKFSTLLKRSEGFVKDDKLVVEARILIKDSSCVKESCVLDFTQPIYDADNIVLNFDNGTLHSCRRYLMWHSPYFASLFLQDMNKDEFGIEGVKTEDFAELLHVIFPSERPINADSCQIILALAERFQIEYALDLAEKFLINTENVKMSTKLLLTDQFKLDSLKKYCLNSLKTPKEIKSLETSNDFRNMSTSLKVSLLAKLFELIK